jgi:anaerobic magnesium-protoporphyrin IX monomethyl ester cyclase
VNRVLPGVLSASSPDPSVKSGETAEIALIGYQDQGNLGMGYLSAVLQRRGHSVLMIDVRDGPEKIAERLVARQPLVVGLSLIFQVFLPQFRKLARRLRGRGNQLALYDRRGTSPACAPTRY